MVGERVHRLARNRGLLKSKKNLKLRAAQREAKKVKAETFIRRWVKEGCKNLSEPVAHGCNPMDGILMDVHTLGNVPGGCKSGLSDCSNAPMIMATNKAKVIKKMQIPQGKVMPKEDTSQKIVFEVRILVLANDFSHEISAKSVVVESACHGIRILHKC